MKKRFIAGIALALMMASTTFAETLQTLTINGERVEKVVTRIHFDGDNVVLHFGDETQSVDMNAVSLAFVTTSGVNNLQMFSFNGAVSGTEALVSGVAPATEILVYNLQGVAVASAVADSDGSATVDVSSLAGGVYILRAGNNCVKFVKK